MGKMGEGGRKYRLPITEQINHGDKSYSVRNIFHGIIALYSDRQ